MDVPRLSLDRPFTYLLPEGTGAGCGSLVSVPFHGRTLRAWVLGPAADVPDGRLLPVRKVRSPVRYFDERMLAVLRAVSERYLAPLCTVIERSHPPRIAGEERSLDAADVGPPLASEAARAPVAPGPVTWVRPLPGREAGACLEAVGRCVDEGRQALVLVPEAEPLPFTAAAVIDAFGQRAIAFVGGDPRERYRTWLRIRAGEARVVVGTRPAVFAPLAHLGLIWISRETHPGHREDRSPYYHVRDVGAIRARIEGASCALASFSPSVDTAQAAATGAIAVRRPRRDAERAAAPLVETTLPEAEDRSRRLGTLLRGIRSGALIVSRRGYGLARVCRACTAPAACASCGGPLVAERGRLACRTCGADARCRSCGAGSFGVERRGTERIAEWAGRLAAVPVVLAEEGVEGAPTVAPGPARVLVGTAAAVKDVGPQELDLVAILDPDRALVRPGLHAGEQVVATWMEAAAWARPRSAGGRVLVQARHPESPAVQALIRWDPVRFLEVEARRRADAGFPANHPVFRIEGPSDRDLDARMRALEPVSLLVTSAPNGTVCLVTVRPAALAAFRAEVLRLAADGSVTRVEAEPHL